jgi:hypothetical protein
MRRFQNFSFWNRLTFQQRKHGQNRGFHIKRPYFHVILVNFLFIREIWPDYRPGGAVWHGFCYSKPNGGFL